MASPFGGYETPEGLDHCDESRQPFSTMKNIYTIVDKATKTVQPIGPSDDDIFVSTKQEEIQDFIDEMGASEELEVGELIVKK